MTATAEMTMSELTAAERKYDNANNEGAEGYNPYRAEREDRERKQAASLPRTQDDILRELERLDCSLARECGTYDADKIAALKSELAAMEKADDDEFLTEWTVEVTNARRSEWNAEVKKLVAKHGKNVPGREVYNLEERLGYTLADIRKAKQMHSISK